MKVSIIYFSQTGNTRRVGEALAAGFRDRGAEVKRASLQKAEPGLVHDCDLVGMGTPCFNSRAPRPILDFIASLPPLEGRPAFVFATSGGGPGRVLFEMTTALRNRGGRPLAGLLLRGQCFHPFPAIHGRFPGRPDAADLNRARTFARSLHDHLTAGRTDPLPESRPDALYPGRGFYDLVAVLNSDRQLRAALKAPQVDPQRCNLCRLCEHECPTHSIVLAPYPVITGNRCLRCYRCYTACPEQAFTADLRLGNFLAHVFYNTWFERLLGDVGKGERFYK
jgi:flavodoxin/ferredoxin